MFEFIFDRLNLINIQIFLSSILFFFIGYALAPTAYYKKVTWLTAYPLWIARKLEAWSKKKWNGYVLFLFLFALNSLSLTINFLSGWAPLLPAVFAVWTGLNVGLVTYHTLKGHFYFASLLNPVALFELPAAFISFTLAIQFNLSRLSLHVIDLPAVGFGVYMNLFLITVIPLLIISGIIEAAFIIWTQKINDEGEE